MEKRKINAFTLPTGRKSAEIAHTTVGSLPFVMTESVITLPSPAKFAPWGGPAGPGEELSTP